MRDYSDMLCGGCPNCRSGLHQSREFGIASCLECGWLEEDGCYDRPLPVTIAEHHAIITVAWAQWKAGLINWFDFEAVDGALSMERWRLMPPSVLRARASHNSLL